MSLPSAAKTPVRSVSAPSWMVVPSIPRRDLHPVLGGLLRVGSLGAASRCGQHHGDRHERDRSSLRGLLHSLSPSVDESACAAVVCWSRSARWLSADAAPGARAGRRRRRARPTSPPGSKRTTRTIAAPYRKAAAWLATMPGSPGFTMNGSEPAYCWKTSGSALTKAAPRIEPDHRSQAAQHDHREELHREREPERVRGDGADRQRVEHAGEAGVHGRDQERLAPCSRGRRRPSPTAATSLSRRVCSARPGRERSRFEANQQAPMHSTRPRYQSRSACPKGTPRTSRYGESVAAEAEAEQREVRHQPAVEAAGHRASRC